MGEPISEWDDKQIKLWSREVRQNPLRASNDEKVAVLKRAAFLNSGRRWDFPRETQLVSLLILLNAQEGRGRLIQVNTGEGKTLIVSMLAVMKALDGRKVDIITSSPELARLQCGEQRPFFQMFDLEVAHIGSGVTWIEDRYKADILYGAAADFQADILRDGSCSPGLRSGRNCEVAIVDEVDSMLIDGSNYMVMLSSAMPGMDHLEPILAAIWLQIGVIASSFTEDNGITYFRDSSNQIRGDGSIDNNVEPILVRVIGTKAELMKSCTINYIRKVINDRERLTPEDIAELDAMAGNSPHIDIPIHLRTLVTEAQLERWVDSAIVAKYKYEEGKQYILRDNKIFPVDAVNTGIIQSNMHWNNGLHQFLQIKHGIKINAERFTTNFLSNVSFFMRYGSNIFGLTGTLGSHYSRQLLHRVYNVDTVIVPPFRETQFVELTPRIVHSKPEWYNIILESTLDKLQRGRAVLILTKYIVDAEYLKQLLMERYDGSRVRVYKEATDSNVINQPLDSGEVIIATNIAGRGTDIRLTESVERNGGLHVCITFFPPNERVEQQNMGRTSRTGNRGTGQLILLTSPGCDIATLRQQRQQNEEQFLATATVEIKKVIVKDKLFQRFCNLVSRMFGDEFPAAHEQNPQPLTIFTDACENIFNSFLDILTPDRREMKQTIQDIKKRALEERFGIWLTIHENEFNRREEKEVLEMFSGFEREVLGDKRNNNLIRNPFFHVLCGNEYVHHKEYSKAVEEYNKSIDKDPNFAFNAYYGRGYALLAEYGRNTKNYNTKTKDAVEDLRIAKKIIEEKIEPQLQIIQLASDSEVVSEQVKNKITLYGIQKNTIDSAIGLGRGMTRQMIESLEESRAGRTEEEINEINDRINVLQESDADLKDIGIIGKANAVNRGVEVELVPLNAVFPAREDINLCFEETVENKNNGFIGNFKVSEIVPINWKALLGLLCTALVQMIAGGALILFTGGFFASMGMHLITEGCEDMITIVKDIIIGRTFDWVKYGIQKAISLTVGLLCAGWSSIKSVLKSAITGVVNRVEQYTVKQVCVKIGKKLAQVGAKAIVDGLVDLGVDNVIMPSIKNHLVNHLEPKLQSLLQGNRHIAIFLETDKKNRNRFYESMITERLCRLFQKEVKKENSLWSVYLNGVATELRNKAEKPGIHKHLKKAIHNTKLLLELYKICEEIIEEEISNIAEECCLDDSESVDEAIVVNSAPLPRREDGNISGDEDDINLDVRVVKRGQLAELHKSPEQLGRTLSNTVASQMCEIIESGIIKPPLHYAANYGASKAWKYVRETLAQNPQTPVAEETDRGGELNTESNAIYVAIIESSDPNQNIDNASSILLELSLSQDIN